MTVPLVMTAAQAVDGPPVTAQSNAIGKANAVTLSLDVNLDFMTILLRCAVRRSTTLWAEFDRLLIRSCIPLQRFADNYTQAQEALNRKVHDPGAWRIMAHKAQGFKGLVLQLS
jgi:hypothetical protein